MIFRSITADMNYLWGRVSVDYNLQGSENSLYFKRTFKPSISQWKFTSFLPWPQTEISRVPPWFHSEDLTCPPWFPSETSCNSDSWLGKAHLDGDLTSKQTGQVTLGWRPGFEPGSSHMVVICGGQSGAGASFLLDFRFPLPANLHSTNFSAITLTYHPGLVQ
jgi:hypothetical protein